MIRSVLNTDAGGLSRSSLRVSIPGSDSGVQSRKLEASGGLVTGELVTGGDWD